MRRLPLLVLAGVAGAALVCGAVQPINSTLLRLLTLGAAALFFCTVLVLFWDTRPLRWGWLGMLVALLLVVHPGRPHDVERLRETYTAALERYEGVKYVWGGEGMLGIDCSGLPRRALRDALFVEGVGTLNGRLIREAIWHWWWDASARALSEGYQGYMKPLFTVERLREADFSTLQPGDVAVTASGIHCLVYLREDSWIQADPGVGQVATFDARTTANAWFDDAVGLHRWAILH